MKTVKYSVIIPIFNAEKTLKRCIDSVISAAKGRSDVELLLVNDGSNDGSDNICRNYANNFAFVKYCIKDNGGVSSARNLGIDMSKGKYITFVDSDDFVTSHYFRDIDKVLIKYDYDYIVFGLAFIRSNDVVRIARNKNRKSNSEYQTAKIISHLITNGRINAPSAKVYKKQIIMDNNIKFLEGVSIAEDWNFNIVYSSYISSMFVSNICNYNMILDNNNSLSRSRMGENKRFQLYKARENAYEIISAINNDIKRKMLYDAMEFIKYRSIYSDAKIDYKNNLSKKERYSNTKNRCKELNKREVSYPMSLYCFAIVIPIKLCMAKFINHFAECLVKIQ